MLHAGDLVTSRLAELIEIINKLLVLHLVGCLRYCTVLKKIVTLSFGGFVNWHFTHVWQLSVIFSLLTRL